MPDAKKISELPIVETLTASDLFETSHVGTDVPYESCKTSLAQVSNTVAGSLTYGSLQTSNKTIIGAINEALASGGDVSRAEFDSLKRSNDALWKLTEGQVYDIETKEETGTNAPPSGAQFESVLEVHGNSKQETTLGVNTLPAPAAGTKDNNGVRLISDGEGGFTASRTSTGTSNARFPLPKPFTIPNSLDTGGTAVLYLFNSLAYESGVTFRLYSNGTQVAGWSINAENRIITNWTTGVGQVADEIGIYVRSGTNVDGLTFKPMFVEDGITTHVWEPYTGGIPSPNPGYPQDIKAVEEINISVNGVVKTIVPPFPLNKIGDVADMADVDAGVWRNNFATVDLGTLAYTWASVGSQYYAQFNEIQRSDDYTKLMKCRSYSTARNNNTMANFQITGYIAGGGYVGQNWIYVSNPVAASAVQLREMLRGIELLYLKGTPTEAPIDAEDLAYLRSLSTLPTADVVTITDQDGDDISYLMEYIIKLSEVN